MDQPGHETSDVNVGRLAVFGAGVAAMVLVSLLAMAGLFQYLAARSERRDVPPSPLASRDQTPPEPRLQTAPSAELRRMREHEEAVLSSYGWVDRDRGVARIPIERAMDLLVERERRR